MQKPIIGIIGKQILHHAKPHSISSMTRNEVKQAIIDHGGTPIGILSPIPETFEQADPNLHNLPESLYQSHALSSHIFTAFIAASKEYQTNTANQH